MIRTESWHSALPDPRLDQNVVHLWRASLQQPAELVEKLRETLSADEGERADRFRVEGDRRRFVVGRGTLRAILGRYLGMEPARVRFGYGPHGKPYLATGIDDGALQFSAAHSHELALYVVAQERACGVDLEWLQPIPDAQQIADSFFSASERDILRELPNDQRERAFYNCWTRKEAFVKARGEGLACDLDRFEVSLRPGEPARLLSIDGDVCEAARWSMEMLIPTPGYLAALAVEGSGWHLTCYQYDWGLDDTDEENAD